MKVDPTLEVELRSFFKNRNYPMPLSNLKQATLIPSARPIYNPRGTAPGWWVESDDKRVICMPGPPGEMQRMWNKEVSPELKKLVAGGVLVSRTVKTFGLSEGGLDEMVASLLSSRNPTIGVYAKDDGIHLRITAKADDEERPPRLSSKTWRHESTTSSANISGARMRTPSKATSASFSSPRV